jgi:hypothetical protein
MAAIAAHLPAGWVPVGQGVDFSKMAFPPSVETKSRGFPMPAPPKMATTTDAKEGLHIGIDGLTTICGMPGSGKTNLLRNLVRANAKDYNLVMLLNPVMSDSNVTDINDYSWLPPDFKEDDPKKFTERIEEMKVFLTEHKNAHGLLILDDCRSYFNKNKALFEEIGSINRKYRLSVVVIVQFLQGSPTGFRQSVNQMYITSAAGKTPAIVSEVTNLPEREVMAICEEALTGDGTEHNVVRFNNVHGKPKFDVFKCPKAPIFALRHHI